jgi:hypothetical protein
MMRQWRVEGYRENRYVIATVRDTRRALSVVRVFGDRRGSKGGGTGDMASLGFSKI